MNHFKITLLQKNLNQEISKELKQKIISQKSDFLLISSPFPISESSIAKNIVQNSKKYVDQLLEISEYYKGVIIGGGTLRVENGKIFQSCPLIQDIQLIDWYDAKNPEKIHDLKIEKSNGDSIYILGKIRFGMCIGEESKDEKLLSNFQKERIELIFNPFLQIANDDSEYSKELDSYAGLSTKYNLNIVKVNSVGKYQTKELSGRSFHSGPQGIKWKVATSEKNSEIIKTLSITLVDSILSFKS